MAGSTGTSSSTTARGGAASSSPARHRAARCPGLGAQVYPPEQDGRLQGRGMGMEELLGERRCQGKTPRVCAPCGLTVRAQPQRGGWGDTTLSGGAQAPVGCETGDAGAGPGTCPPREMLGSLCAHRQDPHRVLHCMAPSRTLPAPGEPTRGPPWGHGPTASPRANSNGSLSGNAAGR